MEKTGAIRAAIFGTVVGDALGVPVEFRDRSLLKADPVTGMREYGTHHQPAGTWSDDSSMMLATMDNMPRADLPRPEELCGSSAGCSRQDVCLLQ